MASIADLSIVGPNDGVRRSVDWGTETTLCGAELCGSKELTVSRGLIAPRQSLTVEGGGDYHLLYVVRASAGGEIRFRGESHSVEAGAGVLMTPGEKSAAVGSSDGQIELLHLVATAPPAAVEAGLPGGPGYFFNRSTLRALTDASGGRVRRFCAESSIKLRDGSRLTPTNAIQAGEMHYHAGGSSPYHVHRGTPANPRGADHCYITFQGHGRVEVEGDFRDVEPGTLVYFPPGVSHRLSARGGPLDYFEIQAWRSFKTTVLSEEPLGLKWYYESDGPERVEWDQS